MSSANYEPPGFGGAMAPAIAAARSPSSFARQAQAALATYREHRTRLANEVREGNLTHKAATNEARRLIAEARAQLTKEASTFSPALREIPELLERAMANRQAARAASPPVESRLDRLISLMEVQALHAEVQARAAEFRSRSYSHDEGGAPVATLDSLLRFHRHAAMVGDRAAVEFGRQELLAFRASRLLSREDQLTVARAVGRPGEIEPLLLEDLSERLAQAPPEALHDFLRQAIATKDPTAYVAVFGLARTRPWDSMPAAFWTDLFGSLDAVPDETLERLAKWELADRAESAHAAQGHVESALAFMEGEASFDNIKPLTYDERLLRDRIKPGGLSAEDDAALPHSGQGR